MSVTENKWFYTYQERNELVRKANGYCLECQRPLLYKPSQLYLCPRCYARKIRQSFDGRIKLGTIGEITMNYQQHLHRKFFGCNAPVHLRGIRENRIRNHIKEETINKAIVSLHNRLMKHPLIAEPYRQIEPITNITRRLVYNATLYYISYYIENKFKSEEQFYASVSHSIETEIKRTHLRLVKAKKIRSSSNYYHIDGAKRIYTKYNKELVLLLDRIIKPIVEEIFK